MATPTSHVHAAVISLMESAQPEALGAAVTTALCGAAEHDGPCRWPHNNAVILRDEVAVFRTVFIAPDSEEREVRARIRSALRSSNEWDVLSDRSGTLTPQERALAARLARTQQQSNSA
jgi:hypothetical protein